MKTGGSHLLKHYYIIFILLGFTLLRRGFKSNNILYIMQLSDWTGIRMLSK